MVSLVAWFALGPVIASGLYGGAVADRFDRRWRCRRPSWGGRPPRSLPSPGPMVTTDWAFYVITTVNAVAATIASATRQAITPRLLPLSSCPRRPRSWASRWSDGHGRPDLAGVLVARVGYAWTYTVDVVPLPGRVPRPVDAARRSSRSRRRRGPHGARAAVLEGLAHLRGAQRPDELRRRHHRDDLRPADGALPGRRRRRHRWWLGDGRPALRCVRNGGILSSLGSGRVTGIRWQGRAIRNAIVVYGIAILGFGVVLAVVMLGGTR